METLSKAVHIKGVAHNLTRPRPCSDEACSDEAEQASCMTDTVLLGACCLIQPPLTACTMYLPTMPASQMREQKPLALPFLKETHQSLT